MREIPCPVPPDELRRLVQDEKLKDSEIAVRLPGGTIRRVQSWRERYKIDALERWERTVVPSIEGRLKSLLVGSMLGDGRLSFQGTSAYYAETHCEAQRVYTEWKSSIWDPWPRDIVDVQVPSHPYPEHRLITASHGSLLPWRDLFYEERERGWKRFPPSIVEHVDAFALAIWYLDDGSVNWWPDITFGASPESRGTAYLIFEKFGLTPRWQSKKGNTGDFHFEREETALRFLDIIRLHVPECMAYKLSGFGFQGHNYQLRSSLSEERLRELVGKGISIRKIAEILNQAPTTVDTYLKKFGIHHPRKIGRPAKGVRGG